MLCKIHLNPIKNPPIHLIKKVDTKKLQNIKLHSFLNTVTKVLKTVG